MTLNVAWENEEVPTNGKVLAFASDFYSVGMPELRRRRSPSTGCVQFFDVRDPANIKEVGTIPIANHTAECALDCQLPLRQRRHDHRRAGHPRRQGADRDRRLDRRSSRRRASTPRAATTSARSARACCSPPASRSR